MGNIIEEICRSESKPGSCDPGSQVWTFGRRPLECGDSSPLLISTRISTSKTSKQITASKGHVRAMLALLLLKL